MTEPTIGLNLSTNRDHFSLHTVIFLSYGAWGKSQGSLTVVKKIILKITRAGKRST